jgi:hypothetical protein
MNGQIDQSSMLQAPNRCRRTVFVLLPIQAPTVRLKKVLHRERMRRNKMVDNVGMARSQGRYNDVFCHVIAKHAS